MSEGFVYDSWGRRQWGPYGAAGLLIRHRGEDGARYLLQRRAARVDHAGTWSIPGGALRLDDGSVEAGAMREAREELGPLPDLRHVTSVVYDYGEWKFHTVVVDSPTLFVPQEGDGEGAEVRWCTAAELEQLPLHPGFAASWPRVHAAVGGPPLDESMYFGPPQPAEVVGYGWRAWSVTNRGRLVSPLPVNGGLLPWPEKGSVRAVCEKDRAHRAPVDVCFCGLRVMPEWDDFHRALVSYKEAGLAGALWLEACYPELRVPAVVGRVAYWGRVLPRASDDPLGTVRAEYAAVSTDLYVGRHLAETARQIRWEYPGVNVHVGRRSGLAWMNEVAAHINEQQAAGAAS